MEAIDYLAAHAPEEPQSWFYPVVKAREKIIVTIDGRHSFELEDAWKYKEYIKTEHQLQ